MSEKPCGTKSELVKRGEMFRECDSRSKLEGGVCVFAVWCEHFSSNLGLGGICVQTLSYI